MKKMEHNTEIKKKKEVYVTITYRSIPNVNIVNSAQVTTWVVQHQKSRMAEDFNGLDLAEMLQDERRQLSWIIEDMSVLYMENRQILAKIKTLNEELEEFSDDHQENSDDDSQELIEFR